MTETRDDQTAVTCECGAVIGHYKIRYRENGMRRVHLEVGGMLLDSASGWCRCGREFFYSSTARRLDDLIERCGRRENV